MLGDVLERARRLVVHAGHELTSPSPIPNEWDRLLEEVDVIVATPRLHIDRAHMRQARRLRCILFPTIGVDPLDVRAATELGIAVGHGAPAESVHSMAEATVTLIAALMHRLPQKMSVLQAGLWREPIVLGRMLRGKVIGFVGFGRIGQATAALLVPWGARILFSDPFVQESSGGGKATAVALDRLLRESDVISLHTALSADTFGLIGQRQLGLMKRDAVLVNTSRGNLIDEGALVAALESGSLAGAALDVFAEEPLSIDHPLRRLPNVILTPHDIGHTEELMAALGRTLIENLEAVLGGGPPLHLFNHDVLRLWSQRFNGAQHEPL
ncbi:NAD(P)-dependent oxidoreductase [Mesorhizobium sp. WSM4976]|uniref:2-hydroxyacid dehydrogenase n=1 Tax=Mesorhizobium sp. WSM4976 TaxID=3038549 RepID=UPI0024161B71|nr:NAD(P)-dependent oxidoreductase [Mesorhizobium sp. WSM4976]MDG4898567.1 NAD(P)-dependent oxidoreductase [Mesorhizobium sp. WSM4976]